MVAEKPGGLEKIQKSVMDTINKVFKTVIKRAGIDEDHITAVTLAGNTTMTQLLLGVNLRYIRRSPYVPISTIDPPVRAIDLGVDLKEHVTAMVYPVISSYVGGGILLSVSWVLECIEPKN